MNPERDNSRRWERLQELFHRAAPLALGERERLLARECADDPELRREVESLLAADREGAPLSGPIGEAAGDLAAAALQPGDLVGSYRVIRELGRGGMGAVYLAERTGEDFEQQVALKVLAGIVASPGAAERFLAERRILAQLEHPHIARLLDGGTTPEGAPWFAMERVEGEPIDAWCDRRRLPVRGRLLLFLAVCNAVQHAHRRLVVHRDLKPSNILVGVDGAPKLLDFGIAKLLDPGAEGPPQTLLGELPMTPEYASPEQVRGEPVTTASDVYALGLLLYELLTGRRAHRLSSYQRREVERAVCEEPATRPSQATSRAAAGGSQHRPRSPEAIAEQRRTTPRALRRRLAGDLDTIVLAALRKEPEQRYGSVEALAEDIRRHLDGLPVWAQGDRLGYRAGKFVRRHAVAAATSVGVVLLTAGLIGFYTQRLARERNAAERSAARAQQQAVRAAAALAKTEQALARAEALREFLVDLFRAAEPTRPSDQLPTTEEILGLGARRALDETAAPPAERLGMLLTVGRVYLQRGQLQQARPLIDAAVALARDHESERPEDLALALTDQAALAWYGAGTLADAEAALLEAESLVEGEDAFWEAFANARSDRAWVASLRGDHETALALLEPLYRQMQSRDEVSLAIRYATVNRLASTYHQLGDLEAAAEGHAEADELARRFFGEENPNFAIHLANSANVERELGRYEESDSRNLQAIALYDRIYGATPTVYRSIARRNRARTLLAMGRFDEALRELAASTREYARVRGMAAEDDPSRFFYEAEMLIQMHRWPEAASRLRRARELYGASPERDSEPLGRAEAMLVRALCRQGLLAAAERVLETLDDRAADELHNDNRSRAERYTARACVALRTGRHEAALQAVDLALAAVTSPGRVVDRSDRRILRARILAATNRLPEAAKELDRAERLYRKLDLARHPLFAEIDRVRRELSTG